MMQIPEQDKQRLQHIATLIEGGNLAEAKTLLTELQSTSPPSAPMWYLVSLTVDTPEEKMEMLERARAINPDYEPAQRAIRELRTPPQVSINEWLDSRSPSSNPLSSTAVIVIAVLIVAIAIVGALTIRNLPPTTPVALQPTRTMTVTRTRTVSPTPPPLALVTPLPAPFTLPMTRGRAVVTLKSPYREAVGSEGGDILLNGLADLSFVENALSITITNDGARQETWSFNFFAPDFRANTVYGSAVDFSRSNANTPRMSVISTRKCSTPVSGKFIIEQQAPILVLSFLQYCDGYPLRGVLTISPLVDAAGISSQKLALASSMGEARIEVRAGSGELLSNGRGDFVLVGPANLAVSTVSVQLYVRDDDTGEQWRFGFAAPDYIAGKSYAAVDQSNVANPTKLVIERISYGQCKPLTDGNFGFGQQGDELVITYSSICGGDPRQRLDGTIHFRPQTALSPTPTIPPAEQFIPINAKGHATLELYSAPADSVGRGKGNFAVNANASMEPVPLDDLGAVLSFRLSPDQGSVWTLNFWAPSLQLKKTYMAGSRPAMSLRSGNPLLTVGRAPAMLVKQGQYDCDKVQGKFTLEQQAPTIVISFEQWCERDPDQLLRGKLTFVLSAAYTSTPTPSPTLTLTPSYTPKPTKTRTKDDEFNLFVAAPTSTTEVEMEWPTTGVKYVGSSVMSIMDISNKSLRIRLVTHNNWEFRFYAPTYTLGMTYENVTWFPANDKTTPGMSITSKTQHQSESCQDITGSFKLELIGDDRVITFSQTCHSKPELSVRGTIRYLSYESYMATHTGQK
ncbi:MAG: hypothetical protein KF716_27375 [Anaerolineae bacterium]|nr:hypothetical protein [Anaerolineae bacterium]